MNGSFVNKTNNQFIQSRVGSKEGVRCSGQKGGNPYGSTLDSLVAAQASHNMGKGVPTPVTYYNNCTKQKGGGHDYDADFGNPLSYGYTKEGAAVAGQLRGSYAPNQCKSTTNSMRSRKIKKEKKTRKKIKAENHVEELKEEKNHAEEEKNHAEEEENHAEEEEKRTEEEAKHIEELEEEENYTEVENRIEVRNVVEDLENKEEARYLQYGSNIPDTPGYAAPNTGGDMPWATGPVSHVRQINCRDNYNHYKK